MRWTRWILLAIAVATAAGGPALAFSPRTRAEIVGRSLKLMPDGMERQLRKHARSLFSAAVQPPVTPGAEGRAIKPAEQLEAAVAAAIDAIDQRKGMAEVARRFGVLARIASDLSYGLDTGLDDPRETAIRPDFARFIETRLPRMSVTFGGFADPYLAAGDLPGFARSISSKAHQDYESILRSYYPEGRQRLPQDFDDRSVAFAVGSLEVSLAVTATARVWLYAWHLAHGDMSGTPTLDGAAQGAPFGVPPRSGGRQETKR